MERLFENSPKHWSLKKITEGVGAGYYFNIYGLKLENVKITNIVLDKYGCQEAKFEANVVPAKYEWSFEDYYNAIRSEDGYFTYQLNDDDAEQPVAPIEVSGKVTGSCMNSDQEWYDVNKEWDNEDFIKEITSEKYDIGQQFSAGWIHADLPEVVHYEDEKWDGMDISDERSGYKVSYIHSADVKIPAEEVNSDIKLCMYGDEDEDLREEDLEESKLKERNLTRAERHNRDMKRIFNRFDSQNKAMADFLKSKGISEEEIKSLENNTGLGGNDLHSKIDEMGLHDEFFGSDCWKRANESKMRESEITRRADTDEQEATLEVIDRLARDNDIKLRFGTKVGKYPQSVILDYEYQGGEIYVSANGSFTINDEEFGSWKDDYFDINDIDENEIERALLTLKNNEELDESKMRESFHNLSIEELKRVEKDQDPELFNILNTKVVDLPENFRFSFSGKDWQKALTSDIIYIDFLKDLATRYPDFKVLVSEKDNKIIGWMAYSTLPGSVHNIKFGSLTEDPEKNVELLFDCKKQLVKFLEDYMTVYWFACPENDKVFNYYQKIVDQYNKKGYQAGLQDVNGSKLFYISRMDRQIESYIKQNKMRESETIDFDRWYAALFADHNIRQNTLNDIIDKVDEIFTTYLPKQYVDNYDDHEFNFWLKKLSPEGIEAVKELMNSVDVDYSALDAMEEKIFKVEASDINWDTDGEEVDLPSETVVEVEADTTEEAKEKVVDELSDKHGWCINSLKSNVLNESIKGNTKQFINNVVELLDGYMPDEEDWLEMEEVIKALQKWAPYHSLNYAIREYVEGGRLAVYYDQVKKDLSEIYENTPEEAAKWEKYPDEKAWERYISVMIMYIPKAFKKKFGRQLGEND